MLLPYFSRGYGGDWQHVYTEWRFRAPGHHDPGILKNSKILFASFKKNMKKITDVANSVFHKPIKNQLKIICVPFYTKMTKF